MPWTLYLVPQIEILLPADPEQPGVNFYEVGPQYFDAWSENYSGTLTDPTLSFKPYGYAGACLVAVLDVLPASAAFLAAQADVAVFNTENLDAQLGADRDTLATLMESANLPTSWTTPSTTYRELLRYLNGIATFIRQWWLDHIRLTGNRDEFFDLYTLDDKWNSVDATSQAIFESITAEWGIESITGNPTLRTLVKRAGDTFATITFQIGGLTI